MGSKAEVAAQFLATEGAVVDQGSDLMHSALEVAKDADGKVVPKVADVMVVAAPDEASDWAFVRAENAGNTLRYEESNIAIPTARSLRVGANVRY